MTTAKGSHFRTYINRRSLCFLNAWSGILVKLLFWSRLKENKNLNFRWRMTCKAMSKLRTNFNNRKASTRWMMLMIQLLRTLRKVLAYSRRLFQGFPWFCFRREIWKKKQYNLHLFYLFNLLTIKHRKINGFKKIVQLRRGVCVCVWGGEGGTYVLTFSLSSQFARAMLKSPEERRRWGQSSHLL